jgi:dTDP-4-dehydrorhamnose 3,5-epimerase
MTDLPAPSSGSSTLPQGVSLRSLPGARDAIGAVTVLYRRDWKLDSMPVQWNLVSSRANTLRGVHVHLTHWDYLCIISGEMLLALHDMRPGSPTYRLSALQPLPSEPACSVAIPPGVAHGFYFGSQTTYFYAVSHYWNPQDELGCSWNDPELGLSWPTADPLRSPRDANAPTNGPLAREQADAGDGGARRP